MSFTRYPAYKDSGVEWLGHVPEHWTVIRLKNVLAQRITDGPHLTPVFVPDGVPFLSVDGIQNGELTFDSCRYVSEDDHIEFSKKVRPQRDDVLMGKAASTGKIARVKVDFEFSIWSPLALIRVDHRVALPSFVEYTLKSPQTQAEIDVLCTSNTQKNISMDDIPKLALARPPIEEQAIITEFLDRETAKIDALVAEQEQLITLLKEKRQAVISHAVTKGLDPSVPMKDSGVEWLGEVPEHWRIGKVKQFFATTSGSTPNTDMQDVYYNGEIPWIRSLDLTDGDIVEWEVGITPAAIADTACKLLPVGTVLVAMYGGDGTIGKNGLLRIPAATNQAICALLPSPQFDPEFVLAFMQHQRPYWMVGAEGTRKDPNISQDRVRNALMPCPPLSEQRVIVEHVKQALSAFGSLEKEAEAVIGILNERRSALISAAVTGQIDVRQLAQ